MDNFLEPVSKLGMENLLRFALNDGLKSEGDSGLNLFGDMLIEVFVSLSGVFVVVIAGGEIVDLSLLLVSGKPCSLAGSNGDSA